jgi:hypothetical protein
MNVAITAQLDRNPWKNKGKQSSINLYDAIQNLGVKVCYIIKSNNYKNFNKDHVGYTESNIVRKRAPSVSLLIIDGYIPSREFLENFLLRNPNCKIVRRHEENPLAATCKMISTDREFPALNLVNEIWMPPHQLKHKDYIQSFYNKDCEVKESPYLWSSFFIDESKSKTRFLPDKPKGVSIMERNIDFTKNCLFPLMVAERTNEAFPELINTVSVFNTQKLKKSNFIHSFSSRLKISSQKKLFLSNDWEAPDIYSKSGQYIVSHQMQSSLNYAHLECLHLDIPLIHNAPELDSCGYYYNKNNLTHASNQLANALMNHVDNLPAYRDAARDLLIQFSPGARTNALLLESLIFKK